MNDMFMQYKLAKGRYYSSKNENTTSHFDDDMVILLESKSVYFHYPELIFPS